MKSFAEWAAVGRSVRKGEKARYRRVNEDRTKSIPLFEEDQTDELSDVGLDWPVIPAAEWDLIASQASKPKVILGESAGYVTVWCGSNKKAIKALRAAGYAFDMKTHRWRRKGKPIAAVQEGFENFGFIVERAS